MIYSPTTDFTLMIQPKMYATPSRGFNLNERDNPQDSMWLPPQIEARVGETTYSRNAISTLALAEARNKPVIFEWVAQELVHQMHSFMAEEGGWTKLAKALSTEMILADHQIEAWKKRKGSR